MKRTNQKKEENMGRNKGSNKWRKEGKKEISISLLRRMIHDHLSLLLVNTSVNVHTFLTSVPDGGVWSACDVMMISALKQQEMLTSCT
jgi:hypothetical protein